MTPEKEITKLRKEINALVDEYIKTGEQSALDSKHAKEVRMYILANQRDVNGGIVVKRKRVFLNS